jgi:hypothetical protein
MATYSTTAGPVEIGGMAVWEYETSRVGEGFCPAHQMPLMDLWCYACGAWWFIDAGKPSVGRRFPFPED